MHLVKISLINIATDREAVGMELGRNEDVYCHEETSTNFIRTSLEACDHPNCIKKLKRLRKKGVELT